MKTKIIICITLLTVSLLFSQDDYVCWNKTYGGAYNDWASSIIQLIDGSYVVGGSYSYQYSDDWYVSHAQLNRLDSLGNIIWEIPYIAVLGSPSAFYQVIETSDSNIVALANLELPSIDGRRYAADILKIDYDGNLLWRKYYTHGQTMSAFSITETTDNGLAICGDS